MTIELTFPENNIDEWFLSTFNQLQSVAKSKDVSMHTVVGLAGFPYYSEDLIQYEFSYPELISWSERLREHDYHTWIANFPFVACLFISACEGTYEDVHTMHPTYEGKDSPSVRALGFIINYYHWLGQSTLGEDEFEIDSRARTQRNHYLEDLTNYPILERFCLIASAQALFNTSYGLYEPSIPEFAITLPDVLNLEKDHPIGIVFEFFSNTALTFENIHSILRGLENPISDSLPCVDSSISETWAL